MSLRLLVDEFRRFVDHRSTLSAFCDSRLFTLSRTYVPFLATVAPVSSGEPYLSRCGYQPAPIRKLAAGVTHPRERRRAVWVSLPSLRLPRGSLTDVDFDHDGEHGSRSVLWSDRQTGRYVPPTIQQLTAVTGAARKTALPSTTLRARANTAQHTAKCAGASPAL